jgi:hypothetical protein
MPTLRVVKETKFKQKPVDSTKLPSSEYTQVENGQLFELAGPAESVKGDPNHLKITLKEPLNKIKTWYVYKPDVFMM